MRASSITIPHFWPTWLQNFDLFYWCSIKSQNYDLLPGFAPSLRPRIPVAGLVFSASGFTVSSSGPSAPSCRRINDRIRPDLWPVRCSDAFSGASRNGQDSRPRMTALCPPLELAWIWIPKTITNFKDGCIHRCLQIVSNLRATTWNMMTCCNWQ